MEKRPQIESPIENLDPKNPDDPNVADGVHKGDSPVSGLTLRHILRGHTDKIGRISWSPDGCFLASPSLDGTVRIWDWSNESCLTVLKSSSEKVHCLAWSPNNQLLAAGGDNAIIDVWDTNTWKIISKLESPHPRVWSLAWYLEKSRPERLKLASSDQQGEVTIWDTEKWAKIDSFYSKSKMADDTYINKGFVDNTLDAEANWIYSLNWLPYADKLILGPINSRLLQFYCTVCGKIDKLKELPSVHIYDFAPSPRDKTVAIANGSNIIILDPQSSQIIKTFEGHTGQIRSISFSSDGRVLVSKSMDETVKFWSVEPIEKVAELKESDSPILGPGIAFHPNKSVLATLGDENTVIRIWDLDLDTLLARQQITEFIHYTSAKIVLVGESKIGKSCLAMRLAEDRYPEDHEQGTTHGMRIWPMKPEQLSPKAIAPRGERRDIVLWDLGGQDDYRLIHQLFLHDTTLALVLFDPTLGPAAFDEIKAWVRLLEKQLHGRKAIKILVGSKMDRPSALVDRKAVDSFVSNNDFEGYYETSALNGRGISELKDAIANAINWEHLGKTSRPEIFQHIRDEIDVYRKAGSAILYSQDLDCRIREQLPETYEQKAVAEVVQQLAEQGEIATTRLTSEDIVLILSINEIDRYACSIIGQVRNNLHGVPVLEERTLSFSGLSLPGIANSERLRRDQERVILEAVIELLIQSGICFRSQGLLVFPTLFPEIEADSTIIPEQSHLYSYDFTGPIDRIYASLVARLATGGEFGYPRLWANRAEFDKLGQGICGIHQINYSSGLSSLRMYISETTADEIRDLFIRFVEDHLRFHGVEVGEYSKYSKVICDGDSCGFVFSEDIIHENIEHGHNDLICPKCRKVRLISESLDAMRKRDRESDKRIIGLRTMIEKQAKDDVKTIKKAMASGSNAIAQKEEPIRILHLSDLHFTRGTSPETCLQWLIDDITKGEYLGFKTIEYLVITGDVTDRGKEEGFEKARKFVQLLIEKFGLSAQRCIFVPGNHDVQYLINESYNLTTDIVGLKPEQYVKQDSVYFVYDDEKNKLRLRKFSDTFFHKIIQKSYPTNYADQGTVYLYPETCILFFAFNSCWQIDYFNPKRSGIHPDAIAHAIDEADEQVQDAIKSKQLNNDEKILKIGLWHHAVEGPDSMTKTDFIGHLKNNGIKICLHGDVHESRREIIRPWESRQLEVIGAGSFGSPPEGRPESTACLYNILEIQRDFSSVRVHTRKQSKANGPWEGLYEWERTDGQNGRLPYYDIPLKW